ncbi:MAG: phenol hydroxylase [Glaciimonas sp.]|nr:phenol hydroxylase [Glaciimonas sp.]
MEGKIFDTTHKYVRVVEIRQDGMVGFEFAIGEPELFVELMMPAAAFKDFCEVNQVALLAPATAQNASDPEGKQHNDWDWSLRKATHQRFKSTK